MGYLIFDADYDLFYCIFNRRLPEKENKLNLQYFILYLFCFLFKYETKYYVIWVMSTVDKIVPI